VNISTEGHKAHENPLLKWRPTNTNLCRSVTRLSNCDLESQRRVGGPQGSVNRSISSRCSTTIGPAAVAAVQQLRSICIIALIAAKASQKRQKSNMITLVSTISSPHLYETWGGFDESSCVASCHWHIFKLTGPNWPKRVFSAPKTVMEQNDIEKRKPPNSPHVTADNMQGTRSRSR